MSHCKLSIISRGSEIFFARCLDDFGITASEAIILMYLYEHDKPRQEDLSDYFMLDKGTIAKTLRKLENKEMIERFVNTEDQREKVINVIEKGLCIKDMITNLVRLWHEKMFEGLSQSDILLFEHTLSKITDNVTHSLEEWETIYVKR